VNNAICEKLLRRRIRRNRSERPIFISPIGSARCVRRILNGTPSVSCVRIRILVTMREMREMQFDEFGNVEGKFLFLDVRKAPLFDNTGKLIGIVGTARDVTAQKEDRRDTAALLPFP
jgi:hypothetical protein